MVVFEDTALPLSELDIKRVEHFLGTRLPQDLKEHYLQHNGGTPRPQFFIKDGEAYDVREFLPMNTRREGLTFERSYVVLVDQTPEFPRGYIPFAYDSAGDYFLYSVTPKSFGNIMFNSQAAYGDEDRFTFFLASSLREFIDSLTELPVGME
ncbi:SMI1/KNR4 family protein [Bradyrhizobium sp. INPA01-394B]|uniref:SMI1/KNR4 family protein n=1 Tax=Bradyrhizobium campsiandrae TaxID=1729892 RepID=A0ABR7U9M5_9BRAD|nr:SMI1/KNR4 family protein [Bradyrhizobium campsiandrae]MBC9876350.1 SMI1/KNR4 family protein [Bradyrhizobium campsiandrae]MBC9980127.1 SMI1/KNR4 family protein [Bradyrhizobium campsiandrae]